jgi:hypothetical protein
MAEMKMVSSCQKILLRKTVTCHIAGVMKASARPLQDQSHDPGLSKSPFKPLEASFLFLYQNSEYNFTFGLLEQ